MRSLFQRSLASAALALTAVAASIPPSAAQEAASRLNPNTATAAELAEIEAVPDELAEAIIAARPFERTSEYDELVSGTLEGADKTALYEQLFLPIDLNEATQEEIAVIPGMSNRMIHEFEEYRPYTSIDQFNREIGKYVDEGEVARLRSYVSLGD
jgi:DNA uptake protein ComE-like DNA-binding protein